MEATKHPKALYLLFFTEMWERFSYYGMRALLVFYMVAEVSKGGLGWATKDAGQMYGFYTGLVYVTPMIGGYLADRFLGNRKSIIIGAILMALGHGVLAIDQIFAFFLGMILLIIGNGFFKPNISSLVGQLYPDQSPLKDAGYTIFYMGINVGAFFGTLICGYLGEKYGWHYGFGAAGIGMTLGLFVFLMFQHLLGNLGLKPLAIISTQKTDNQITKIEKDRLKVVGVLSVLSIVFWLAFEQAGSSISLFALNFTDRNISIFGEIPASWFQSVNPFFIFFLAPLMTFIWQKLTNMKKNPSSPKKFSIGLFLLGLGFAVIAIGAMSIPQGATKGSLSMWWIVGTIFIHTIGELCLSPVGLATVNKLSPKKYLSLMFGIWFIASAIGNYIGGALSGYVDEISAKSSISSFFLIFVASTWLFAIVTLIFSKKLGKLMHGVE